ncbi:MAG TPA: hypothetical protein VGS20_10300 [Candidatus Acidoferrales bacterium]|nr:hypothetical protein [Candidatus Acidoferrales bacterium]
MSRPRLAVLYEHSEWFKPLFAELERRRIAFVPLYAGEMSYDPAARSFPYPLVLNRMSPSSYLRGHGQAIFFCRDFLRYLENVGVRVINGWQSYMTETSKCAQIEIFERLGVRYPSTRVVNHPSQILEASAGLDFPVVVKPNVGGSGAKIQHFPSRAELEHALEAGAVELGFDNTALVQEFLPARGGAIVRVEVLDRKFLYAIRVVAPGTGNFNLCPADICQDEASGAAAPAKDAPITEFCPVAPAEKRRLHIEGYRPSAEIIRQALAIAREARMDVGGIEYLENERDGRHYFYDANALSNFVTDAPRIVGFDPWRNFVDFIERRLKALGKPVRGRSRLLEPEGSAAR